MSDDEKAEDPRTTFEHRCWGRDAHNVQCKSYQEWDVTTLNSCDACGFTPTYTDRQIMARKVGIEFDITPEMRAEDDALDDELAEQEQEEARPKPASKRTSAKKTTRKTARAR